MISLAGKNFKKVLTWKKCEIKQEYVECFSSEAEMIEKFVEYIKKENPDILVLKRLQLEIYSLMVQQLRFFRISEY